MVISEKKKFIFIHIPKTGGMSVKAALRPYTLRETCVPKRLMINAGDINKHDTALQVRGCIDPQVWGDYYKFSFVRNPFDWAVSLYHYVKKDKKDPRHAIANRFDFKKFMCWFRAASPNEFPARRGQKHYLIGSGKSTIVDFVGRFENLDLDFGKVCSRLKIKVEIPHINTTRHRHYKEYYDEETRRYVNSMFIDDIKFFGYTF